MAFITREEMRWVMGKHGMGDESTIEEIINELDKVAMLT